MIRRSKSPIEDTIPRLILESGDGFLVTEDVDAPLQIEGVHDFIMLEGAGGGRLLAEDANTRDFVTAEEPGFLLLETGDKLLEETD